MLSHTPIHLHLSVRDGNNATVVVPKYIHTICEIINKYNVIVVVSKYVEMVSCVRWETVLFPSCGETYLDSSDESHAYLLINDRESVCVCVFVNKTGFHHDDEDVVVSALSS